MSRRGNHYERAFESYLQKLNISYVAIDQARKAILAGAKIKSFDFIVYPDRRQRILADVKGRKLALRTFRRRGLGENWATVDDINGLRSWEEVFGGDHLGVFVFAYWIHDLVEADGEESVYLFEGRKYAFVAAELFGYQLVMKSRSPRWKTVFVPAGAFGELAQPFDQFIGKR